MFIAACVIFALVACTGGTQSPGSTGPQNVDPNAPSYERVVVSFENLAATLSGVNGDCDKLASSMSTWTSHHNGSYGGLSANARTEQLSAAARDDASRRLNTALGTIVDAMGQCGDHPGAQKAFTEFDVLVDPQ